jgi:hypothetical protein
MIDSARAALALFAVLAGVPICAAQAQDPPTERAAAAGAAPRIVDVRVGFAGRFKVGYWTPAEVVLEGGSQPASGRVELVAPDGDGVPSRVVAPAAGEVTLAPGERRIVPLSFKLGQLAAEVTVGFRGPAGLVAERRFSTQADGPLAGVLPSSQPLLVAIGKASDTSAAPDTVAAMTVARVDDFDRLPANWWDYEGVNAVVVTTDDDVLSAQLAAARPQTAALQLWVRMGGHLVLSVGRHAKEVLAAGSPWAEFAPGKLDSMVTLRQTAMFETYVETNDPLSTDARFALEVPKLAGVRGRVETFAGTHPGDLPLVVRGARGFGEVAFAAFDLERPPFADWAARPQLFEKLLNRKSDDDASPESGGLGAVSTLGFVDLAGQLRGALDQFSGVRNVPFWLVALLITGYVVCIGPLDYFLVKRLLGRMHATWITFAASVILFSAAGVALAYGLKGRELRVNQIDVVDYDGETNLVRGTTWANAFSPANDTFDLSLAPHDDARGKAGAGRLLSWFGLTGSGFGGMDVGGRTIGGRDTASRTLPLFVEAYDYSPTLDALDRVPIAVWSSKAFVGRWWREAPPPVEFQLTDDGKLAGTLTSRLAEPLSHAVLMYDKWAYVIRDFRPGQKLDVDSIDPQTVDTYLRHVVAQGDRQVAPPYDTASFDVPRIVEIMTAHELAGGRRYTGLANAYQGFAELSDLVANRRAVLVGRSARTVATLNRDDAPLAPEHTQSWTFYRFVFPVAAESTK